MSYKGIIYGRIEGDRLTGLPQSSPFQNSVYTHNQTTLDQLPDESSDHPHLTRHMFSVPMTLAKAYERGLYKNQIISFGLSLKVQREDSKDFELWLQKFESLVLSPLVWRTAVVHFEHEILGESKIIYQACSKSLNLIHEEFKALGHPLEARMKWTKTLFQS